jgi:hypothetical protein
MSITRHLVKASPQPNLFVMKGKLTEPRVITDYRGEPVCILPIGFYLTEDRWQTIWQRFGEKDAALSHEDLRALFPDEPALVPRTSE